MHGLGLGRFRLLAILLASSWLGPLHLACSIYTNDLLDGASAPDKSEGATGGHTGAAAGGHTGAAAGGHTGGQPDVGGQGGQSPSGGAHFGTGGGGPGDEVLASYTFDTTLEGWNVSYVNPLSLSPSASHVDDSGLPDPGAASLQIPFDDSDQKIQFSRVLTNAQDFSGATMSANIRLISGLGQDPDFLGGAKLFVKTGEDFAYGSSIWTSLLTSSERTLELELDWPEGTTPPSYDPSTTVEIGIEIATGSAGTFEAASLIFDTVEIRRPE